MIMPRSDKGKKHSTRGDWEAAYEKYLKKVYSTAARQGLNKDDMADYVLGERDFRLNFKKRYLEKRNSDLVSKTMADSTLKEAGIITRGQAMTLKRHLSSEKAQEWIRDNAAKLGYEETGGMVLNDLGEMRIEDIRGNANMERLYYQYLKNTMGSTKDVTAFWTMTFYYGSK